jgi:hypothetical protein
VSRRLPRAVAASIDAGGIMGIRAGDRSGHKFTGVWPIVIDGRVFARSWTQKPDGWYRAFLEDPRGVIQTMSKRRIRIKAVPVKSKAIRDAIERGYAEKYATKASQKYVRGFRTPRRRDTTTEFIPR